MPKDISIVVDESLGEGYLHMQRLLTDFQSGKNTFNAKGEALFMVRWHEETLGLCGLNQDPYHSQPEWGRVRRMYVRPAARRQGVGSALLQQVLAQSQPYFLVLSLYTTNDQAQAFYRRFGFVDLLNDPKSNMFLDLQKQEDDLS